jgi:hypothetical protein
MHCILQCRYIRTDTQIRAGPKTSDNFLGPIKHAVWHNHKNAISIYIERNVSAYLGNVVVMGADQAEKGTKGDMAELAGNSILLPVSFTFIHHFNLSNDSYPLWCTILKCLKKLNQIYY